MKKTLLAVVIALTTIFFISSESRSDGFFETVIMPLVLGSIPNQEKKSADDTNIATEKERLVVSKYDDRTATQHDTVKNNDISTGVMIFVWILVGVFGTTVIVTGIWSMLDAKNDAKIFREKSQKAPG